MQNRCSEGTGCATPQRTGQRVLSIEQKSVEDLTTDELDRVLKTNLYALSWVTQSALSHLGEGSAIINSSSIQAYRPSTSLLGHAATKVAINNVTVNVAAGLGPRGIRVNAVAPGPIWTPLQPALEYLASPVTASYVSGTVLGVTGGEAVF